MALFTAIVLVAKFWLKSWSGARELAKYAAQTYQDFSNRRRTVFPIIQDQMGVSYRKFALKWSTSQHFRGLLKFVTLGSPSTRQPDFGSRADKQLECTNNCNAHALISGKQAL